MSVLQSQRIHRQSAVDMLGNSTPRITHSQSGFSLIELMIGVAILGIATVLAAPSITNALERQRNKDLAQSIESALREARNEALFRHQNIKVKYENGNGFILLGTNKNKTDDENFIRKYPVKDFNLVQVNPTEITFNSNRTVSLSTSASTLQYQTLCNAKGKLGRVVELDTAIGSASIKTETSQC